MVRTNKEPLARRNEILDVTQRFIYTVGYEQMTIQNIIDELKISKGAFYHYFDSKQALLEALIERMSDEIFTMLQPTVDDPSILALDKLGIIFSTAVRWKTGQKAYMMALLPVWYLDENALVRQKLTAGMLGKVVPMLTQILVQGVREGTFATPFPEQIGAVVMAIIIAQGEKFAELLLNADKQMYSFAEVEKIVAAYQNAIDRILGAPPGALTIMSPDVVREWFPIAETES